MSARLIEIFGPELLNALAVVPQYVKQAARFIRAEHRHNPALVGGLFALGVAFDGELLGVAVVGRPVAPAEQARGDTVELTRCCTDGTRNVASKLYGRAWKAARTLGWRRMITYTLEHESGASLRAANARRVGLVDEREWDRPGRRRTSKHTIGPRVKWEWTV